MTMDVLVGAPGGAMNTLFVNSIVVFIVGIILGASVQYMLTWVSSHTLERMRAKLEREIRAEQWDLYRQAQKDRSMRLPTVSNRKDEGE